VVRPYSQTRDGNRILRSFSEKVQLSELKWHRDSMNRNVTVISGKGWKIQFDNQLPVDLTEGTIHFIPKDAWHRVHRGEGDLVILIEEF
jgi:quercetin dioxygenase-like cupin family protein